MLELSCQEEVAVDDTPKKEKPYLLLGEKKEAKK
jgi:hypothetical protein